MREEMPSPFDRHYGLEIDEATDEVVRAHVPVREHLLQPVGLVHGGVHASIAEALASLGTNVGVVPEGKIGLGQSNPRASSAQSRRGRSTASPAAVTAAARPGSGTSSSPTTTAASAPSAG
jgi:acyl-coenzyme A thioesterase PaaI-like protein